VAVVGGTLIPTTPRIKIGRVHPLRIDKPEVDHGVDVPGVCGTLIPPARRIQLRRIHPLRIQHTEGELGVAVSGVGRLLLLAAQFLEIGLVRLGLRTLEIVHG
jgi:hypothetical protein